MLRNDNSSSYLGVNIKRWRKEREYFTTLGASYVNSLSTLFNTSSSSLSKNVVCSFEPQSTLGISIKTKHKLPRVAVNRTSQNTLVCCVIIGKGPLPRINNEIHDGHDNSNKYNSF
jgi:hypothetical protein